MPSSGAAGGGEFRAEDRDAEVPDFAVEAMERGFGEGGRRGEFGFEFGHAAQNGADF